MAKQPYTQKIPFTNPTGLTVGTSKVVEGVPYVVTAITRTTDRQYKIYGMHASTPIDLKQCKECQRQRESGRLGIYLPGKHILNVTL